MNLEGLDGLKLTSSVNKATNYIPSKNAGRFLRGYVGQTEAEIMAEAIKARAEPDVLWLMILDECEVIARDRAVRLFPDVIAFQFWILRGIPLNYVLVIVG